jgi:hypothetical protein
VRVKSRPAFFFLGLATHCLSTATATSRSRVSLHCRCALSRSAPLRAIPSSAPTSRSLVATFPYGVSRYSLMHVQIQVQQVQVQVQTQVLVHEQVQADV